jgi:membrane dipeptidase
VAILRTVPLIDGHNDIPDAIRERGGSDSVNFAINQPKLMTDIPRLRSGHVGGQFWAAYVPTTTMDSGTHPAVYALEQIDLVHRLCGRYPRSLAMAYTAAQVERNFAAGKVSCLIGIEGGHAIENSLGALRAYYDLGVRYMTLTHNVTLDWADAALDTAKHGGLTPFGKEVVREMNRLGMLVDLSHVSPGVMSDALTTSEAPVIFSHSGARALVNHRRNVPDSILRRVPANGGVVMVPFVTSFVSKAVWEHDSAQDAFNMDLKRRYPTDSAARSRELTTWNAAHPTPQATMKDVADVIDHVRQVAGVDHVGIGSDFDGITDVVVGLEDVSKFPDLFAELARRGWTEADLRKLAGDNLLRAFAQAEAVSQRLRRERPPSTATIQQLDHVTTQ